MICFLFAVWLNILVEKTKNHRNVVVNAIGKEKLLRIYELADVYHSENIDKVTDELIDGYHIETGVFDNVADAKYAIPTYWDIGKVYKRLIIELCDKQDKEPVEALIEVYNSWLSRKIEDFNSSLYFENPDYLYQSYIRGEVL